jgi:hypothetical protein
MSRQILSLATSPQEAFKATKQLIGCFPHARPADPETYADALACVLAQYPLGLVQECVDPRRGLAREREFPPTVACVVDWCDRKLAWHQAVAAYQGRAGAAGEAPMPPASEAECATASRALSKLSEWLKMPPDQRGDPPTWAEAQREAAE